MLLTGIYTVNYFNSYMIISIFSKEIKYRFEFFIIYFATFTVSNIIYLLLLSGLLFTRYYYLDYNYLPVIHKVKYFTP